MYIPQKQLVNLKSLIQPGKVIVVYGARQHLGEAPATIVRDLLAHGWNVPGIFGPSAVARTFADAWASVSGTEYERGTRQRVYQLTDVVHPASTRGTLRIATGADIELLTRWVCGFRKEVFSTGDLDEARQTALGRVRERDIFQGRYYRSRTVIQPRRKGFNTLIR